VIEVTKDGWEVICVPLQVRFICPSGMNSAPEMLDWDRSGLFESVVGFIPNMTAITELGEPT
jgi:hypothetical protein